MIQIELHRNFVKSYDKRIRHNPSLVIKSNNRIELFRKDSKNPLLKDHPLSGDKKEFRSFSVSGDIRIIYYKKSDDRVIFFDIGSHNQVY